MGDQDQDLEFTEIPELRESGRASRLTHELAQIGSLPLEAQYDLVYRECRAAHDKWRSLRPNGSDIVNPMDHSDPSNWTRERLRLIDFLSRNLKHQSKSSLQPIDLRDDVASLFKNIANCDPSSHVRIAALRVLYEQDWLDDYLAGDHNPRTLSLSIHIFRKARYKFLPPREYELLGAQTAPKAPESLIVAIAKSVPEMRDAALVCVGWMAPQLFPVLCEFDQCIHEHYAFPGGTGVMLYDPNHEQLPIDESERQNVSRMWIRESRDHPEETIGQKRIEIWLHFMRYPINDVRRLSALLIAYDMMHFQLLSHVSFLDEIQFTETVPEIRDEIVQSIEALIKPNFPEYCDYLTGHLKAKQNPSTFRVQHPLVYKAAARAAKKADLYLDNKARSNWDDLDAIVNNFLSTNGNKLKFSDERKFDLLKKYDPGKRTKPENFLSLLFYQALRDSQRRHRPLSICPQELDQYKSRKNNDPVAPLDPDLPRRICASLSDKQKEVLFLLLNRKNQRQIAESLQVKPPYINRLKKQIVQLASAVMPDEDFERWQNADLIELLREYIGEQLGHREL